MSRGSDKNIQPQPFDSIISIDPGKKHTGVAVWIKDEDGIHLDGYNLFNFDEQNLDAIEAAMLLYDIILAIPEMDYYNKHFFSHVFYENGFTQPGPAGEAFFNLTTMIRVACKIASLKAMPIAPSSMKRIVGGSGKAEKNEVIERINQYLGLSLKCQGPSKKAEKLNPELYSATDHNIADAIGVGLTGISQLTDPVGFATRGFDLFSAPLGVKRLDTRTEDFEKTRKAAKGARINKRRRA